MNLNSELKCHQITDSEWAPDTPENETSRIWLLAEKHEEEEESFGFFKGVGIAAATTFSLGLCLYANKRIKANRTDSDEFVRA